MKILYITNDCDPRSGRGRLADETISRLQKNNEVIVISERIPEDKSKEIVKIYDHNKVINFIRNIIISVKNSKDVDVIHAMDLWPYGVYAYFAAKVRGKKYIVNGIGTYSVAPLKHNVFKLFLRHVYKKADAIPCISKFVKDEIDKLAANAKTVVVHLGLTKFNKVEANKNILDKYFINENSFPVIVTVGEVKSRKGQLNTAKAVGILKNKYPNIKYLIIGKDFSESYVQKTEETNESMGGKSIYHVTDAKTDCDLRAIYERADVFALNSNNDKYDHFEGFGLVVLEANQFGVPAVGSRGCGIEDAISDGVNGYLCEQDDVENNEKDIAEKIDKILEMKKENKDYWKEKCINWANNFSWDKTVEEYIKMYKKD